MSQSISSAVEHRVHMPAHRAAGQGSKAATPEKLLNGFVRVLAFIERVGNALGTLAFTWATVVLLGGYPTVLSPGWFGDFWCATVIVFLEAIRMFSRNNKLDYQLFFHTKGAFRRVGWNVLIVIVCLSNLAIYGIVLEINKHRQLSIGLGLILLTVIPPVLGMFQSVLKLLPKSLQHVMSICSPVVAILLMILLITMFRTDNTAAKWMVFVLLLLPVLLLTISRLGCRKIIRTLDSALGTRKKFWCQLVLKLCMFAALLMSVFMSDVPNIASDIPTYTFVFLYNLYALVTVSFGNLQIPAAVIRFTIALVRFLQDADFGSRDDEEDSDMRNFVPSLTIFYGMVLGQGALYIVAGMLEIFAFIPRRFLARRNGLGGQWGMELVRLYYAYALEKSMEGDVLAPKNISLNSFAMEYCLNSDKPKMQFHGIRMMHGLLVREETRKELFSKLIPSTKVVARVIEMLDWSSPEDASIRYFAAKVTSKLATSLRVVTLPGTVQLVSSLLDCGNQQKRGNPLLDTIDGQYENIDDPFMNIDVNQDERHDAVQDTCYLLETQEHSTQQVGTTEQHKSWIHTIWEQIYGFWSIPDKEPWIEQEQLLPTLGMSILDGLVGCDQENCVEISRASGLIPKIIRFTRYSKTDTICTDTQREVLMASSLKLLHSITSIHGEIGITLRHKVSKNPFLLRNLADILGDSTSNQEVKKLVAGILRNLAIDGEARQVIGRNLVVISRLMHAFLAPDGSSSTESEQLLRKVAGQALAMLAVDNVNNCLAMVREPAYEFSKELTSMIHVNRYRCVAASLLQDLCRHARPELKEHDLREICYSLREVLEQIMVTEGAELEILIGLSSQICQVIPGDFVRELEQGQIKERFAKRLIDVLNANMEPSADCPGIRRVILEHAISLMEYDSCYANFFKDCRMKDALSMVEETASDVENYRLFLGDAGLLATSEPLSRLVARAKQLLAVH